MARAFIDALGRGAWDVDDGAHPHEAATLALDASLARSALGRQARLDLDAPIAWTADRYRAQLEGRDVAAVTDEQLDRYGDLS